MVFSGLLGRGVNDALANLCTEELVLQSYSVDSFSKQIVYVHVIFPLIYVALLFKTSYVLWSCPYAIQDGLAEQVPRYLLPLLWMTSLQFHSHSFRVNEPLVHVLC